MRASGKHSKQGSSLLDDLRDNIAKCLVEGQIEPARAEQISVELRNRIAADWGGQLIYVPKDTVEQTCKRDRDLYNEFNGTNHDTLASKYGLSMQWVYQIIRRMRIIDRQPSLFED